MANFNFSCKIMACNLHYLHTNTDVTSAPMFHSLSWSHLTVLNFVYRAVHLSSTTCDIVMLCAKEGDAAALTCSCIQSIHTVKTVWACTD